MERVKEMWRKLISGIVMIGLLASLAVGCSKGSGSQSGASAVPAQAGNLVVKVLDVGQSDAILVKAGDQTMLIDSGDISTREQLLKQLQQAGVTRLDKVVITHPHADHLGGMPVLMEKYPIGMIYDSGQTTTTALYRTYMTEVKKKNIPFTVVKAGQSVTLSEGVTFDVLGPQQPFLTESPLNNNSIVLRLQYGQFSMLFTGDAEKEAEERLVKQYGGKLQSQVLKSGHHGSNTSSSPLFLKAVAPAAVVISVGVNNDYHHPHPATLKKYAEAKYQVYRTDQQGAVTITSDGNTYSITKEKS